MTAFKVPREKFSCIKQAVCALQSEQDATALSKWISILVILLIVDSFFSLLDYLVL